MTVLDILAVKEISIILHSFMEWHLLWKKEDVVLRHSDGESILERK